MCRIDFRCPTILSLITLAVLLTCGCDKHMIRRKLNGIMDATIVMPDSISCIRYSVLRPAEESLMDGKRLVVFVDSSECSRCRIEKFIRYQELIDISESTNLFDVIFLLSIKEKSHDEIVEFIKLAGPGYPIYIDENNDFRRLNPSIPNDGRFHTLFIDEMGKVLLVGDPVENASINTLFKELIDPTINGL